MKIRVTPLVLARVDRWDRLTRWERSELGKELRRLGLTYGEIRNLIPVPKGTLSYWCRDIRLTPGQVRAIADRVPTQEGVPKDTQWRRRAEIEQIQREAKLEAIELLDEPEWVAGVALYWGEGAKTDRRLSITNADPRLLRTYISWVKAFVDPDPTFSLAINLHADNDEPAARHYWSTELEISESSFTKTYFKAEGTGHRKNHLAYGVCRVLMRRSTDAWLRTMVWIDELAASTGGHRGSTGC